MSQLITGDNSRGGMNVQLPQILDGDFSPFNRFNRLTVFEDGSFLSSGASSAFLEKASVYEGGEMVKSVKRLKALP